MKFSTLILIGLLCWIGYLISHQRTPIETPASTPAPAEKKEPQLSVEEMRRELLAKFANAERFILRGSVEQHMSTGHLLVHGYITNREHWNVTSALYAVFDVPRMDQIADGTEIECLVVKTGTLEYPTVTGANRTVYSLLRLPTEDETSQWDRYGRPTNRTATPVPAMTPRIVVQPKATPTIADIERQYGTKK